MMRNGHGGDIYSHSYVLDFSANINPLGTPRSVVEAACEGVRLSVHYPDVACRELRGAIARSEGVRTDQVICTNGAAELIYALCLARHPKSALLIAPGFSEYEQALRAAGSEVAYYQCTPEQEFRLDQETAPGSLNYLDRITSDTDMVFLCNPNNPTGALLDRPFLEKVLEKCIAADALMVVDECFIGLVEDGAARTMAGGIGRSGHLFILKAFTKLYAMPGLRLGYGLCSDTGLLEAVHAVIQPWNVSLPAQMAGVAALRETEYVKRSLALITEEKWDLARELSDLGLRCFPPGANYVFFQGPEGLADACADRGILIRDCSNYVGLKKGYYRVAVRTREENQQLLAVLKEILHKQ